MQRVAFASLEACGYKALFSDSYVQQVPREVVHADLIVGLAPGLIRLPPVCTGRMLLYTCNTHVIERTKRLSLAERRWRLECERESARTVDEHLLAYKRADYLLIAENDEGIQNFVKHGIPVSKIKRYNNCVDVDVWQPVQRKRETFSFVCYTSSHGLRRGLPVLLQAWERWFRGQPAELHLLGSSTRVSDQLLNGVRQGQVRPGVHVQLQGFPAQHPPVIEFVSSCHVAVFPTLEDAQPSSLLEMTACGLPVITTVESGVEFNPQFCRYVKADSVEELCAALDYWYARRSELSPVGQMARDYIVANHSWPHFRQRFSAIVNEVK